MTSPGHEGALVAAACKAARSAYAPYSRFCVGAALAATSGRITTGCNVENASYGLTICAERAAVCAAVAAGEQRFEMLAVCAPGAAPPCGACRQVLREFGPELVILLCDTEEHIVARHSLTELLPHSFGPDDLDMWRTFDDDLPK